MNTTTALDTYEAVCDFARQKSEDLDSLRWVLGDCANIVMERWSDKTVEDFSRDIGQHKKTIYQYGKVARFYNQSLRRRLREEMPNLNYSHLRDAMRLENADDEDMNEPIEWLQLVSDMGWSADEASHKLTERLGRQTRESAEGTINSYTTISGLPAIVILVSEDDIEWLTNVSHVTIRPR